MRPTLLTFDSIDSTNTEALKRAREGSDEGLCIVARTQTAGRGRHGRSWVSENDAGLYFSILLRPTIEPRSLSLITLMAGVAVHDTLEDLGLAPDIKWVNDVLVDEKKIAGILAETTETEKGVAVIVGIGINILRSNLPPEIQDTATSIEDHTEALPAMRLAERLIARLRYFYDVLQRVDGTDAIVDEWRRRSTYFAGKPVRAITPNETILGVTDGLEQNGGLRIITDEGTTRIIQAGEIQQLRSRQT